MSEKWGFIGCGHLAQAVIDGALSRGLLQASSVLITNRSPEKARAFSRSSGIEVSKNNIELVQRCGTVVLATKPFDLIEVLLEIEPHILPRHAVLSFAAGVPSTVLTDHLSGAGTLMRVMPNTPALIQKGIFGIFVSKNTSDEARRIISLFEGLGTAVNLRSDKEVDAMTAGSASGTGFVLAFMEEFEKWFVKKGLSQLLSRKIVVQTFLGTASLAEAKSNTGLSELREAVTSPKGTTLAGLREFQKKKVGSGLRSGLDAAFRRSLEIAKSLRQRKN